LKRKRVGAQLHKGRKAKKLRADPRYEEKLIALHRHALQLSSAASVDEIAKYTLDAAEFTLGFDRANISVVEDGCLKLRGIRGAPIAFSVMPLNGPGIEVRAVEYLTHETIQDTLMARDLIGAVLQHRFPS